MTPTSRLSGGRLAVAALLAAMLALTGCAAAEPEPVATPTASPTLPDISTIAVVGDSMSLGVNACSEAGVCERASWAVGTDPAVNSVASRWGQLTGTAPETMALARPGAGIGTRDAAIRALTDSEADLVLVLVGANDVCTASTSAITPTATFAAGYADLLARTHAALPDATMVALSIPDLLQLWRVGRDDPSAVKAWNSSTSCTSMLDDATSDAPDDEARRAAIQDTIDANNAAIVAACAASEGCISDDGAVYAVEFTTAEVSTLDHFHPSIAGQAAIAAAAWDVVERALVP